MAVRLVPLKGGPPIDLRQTINVIGRHAECDVVITESARVSRWHCCVAYVDDRVVARDLGSTNGVKVNGRPILEQTSLRLGDVLTVGDVEFRIQTIPKKIKRRPAHTAAASGAGQGQGSTGKKPNRPSSRPSDKRVAKFTFNIELPGDGGSKSQPASSSNSAGSSAPAHSEFPQALISDLASTGELVVDPSKLTPFDSDDSILPVHDLDDEPSDHDFASVR